VSGVLSIEFLERSRVAEAADILVEAFGRKHREDFEKRLRLSGKGHDHAFVATRDDNVVGVALMTENRSGMNGLPAVRLQDLAVARTARGHGVGRALVLHAENIGAAECLSGNPGFMLLLDDTKAMPGRKNFYNNLGYIRYTPNIRQSMCKPLNGAAWCGRGAL
jgi:predicted N-acetyltransferase YhbS